MTNIIYSAVIDTAGGFAYFGTFNLPHSAVLKVRLSDFTIANSLTLNSGFANGLSSVIDTAAGFAYFATFPLDGVTNHAAIVRVRLSDFSRQGTVQLTGGETNLNSAAIDTAGGFAYFGTLTSPGIIVKIRLSDFTRANAIILNAGENYTNAAAIDPAGGYAYFGTGNNAPSNIVKVRLSDFTRAGTLTLNADEGHLRGSVIDSAGFAYFGTFQCCTGGPGGTFLVRVQVASAPLAPQTLQAAGGSGNITLSWAAPGFNGDRIIAGYKIYRGTSSGKDSTLATVGNVTTYRDSSANASTTYYYKVTALNNFGESPGSNEASANAGASPVNGNILGVPPVAFYGLIGALIAAVAAFTILFLRRRTPVKRTPQA